MTGGEHEIVGLTDITEVLWEIAKNLREIKEVLQMPESEKEENLRKVRRRKWEQ